MFDCLSRKQKENAIFKGGQEIRLVKKLQSVEKKQPEAKKKFTILRKQIPRNGSFVQIIEAQEKAEKISQEDPVSQKKQVSILENRLENNSVNEAKYQNMSDSSDFKKKMQIKAVVSKDEIPSSVTSFGIVLQQHQSDLKKEISAAVQDLTELAAFLPKRHQSSLEGMQKKYLDSVEFDINSQVENEQHQETDHEDLNQEFSKKMIEKDFEGAEKIFNSTYSYIQAEMSISQKNNCDSVGFTPIYLATLSSIVQQQKALNLLKKLLRDPFVNPNKKILHRSKPIEEPILFRNIPTLTHIFRASYLYKVRQVKSYLKAIEPVLKSMPDFTMQIYAKVDSFVPLINKLMPDDKIKIYKKGSNLRIDYSLVGYSFLQSKRRRMSCVIQKIAENDYTIVTINHDKQCYADLLDSLTDQQFVLLIEDMLSTQIKRTNPEVEKTSIKQEYNIFNQAVREFITNSMAVKHQLEVTYVSKTEKLKPRSKNAKTDLNFLNDWKSYQNYQPNSESKHKQKQLRLGVWLGQEFPLKLDQLLEIMKFLSFSHQSGQIIYNFLSDPKIKQLFNGFPVKIEIPINFSLFLDIKISEFTPECPDIKFNFTDQYKKQKRCEYQKTLIRREKRLAFIKFCT